MNVPSYAARIEAKFGDRLHVLNELINDRILHGDFKENARGYEVIRVDLEEWVEEELQKYMKAEYSKMNWDLEFKRDLDVIVGQYWIDIHKVV